MDTSKPSHIDLSPNIQTFAEEIFRGIFLYLENSPEQGQQPATSERWFDPNHRIRYIPAATKNPAEAAGDRQLTDHQAGIIHLRIHSDSEDAAAWQSEWDPPYQKNALRAYAANPRASLISNKINISHSLFDNIFWQGISDLEEIFRPIHLAQKSSESDQAHLGHVTKRWLAIRTSLTLLKDRPGNPFPGLEEVIKPGGIWDILYQQQTTDIHTVAYFLDPANLDEPLTPEAQTKVLMFLKKYIHCDDEKWAEITEDFFEFRQRQGKFNRQSPSNIWSTSLIERPKLFWQHCKAISPLLAQFAHRIFSTAVNSVPSERSFSAMNYIIDKFRASIDVERGNKAIYIYMNSKALDRAKKVATGWFHLGEAEEKALEDDIVAMLEAEAEMVSDVIEEDPVL